MTKTNKSYTKRIKVTKTGKLLARRPGQNHFNAKESRTKQLKGKKNVLFSIKNKARRLFMPGS